VYEEVNKKVRARDTHDGYGTAFNPYTDTECHNAHHLRQTDKDRRRTDGRTDGRQYRANRL